MTYGTCDSKPNIKNQIEFRTEATEIFSKNRVSAIYICLIVAYFYEIGSPNRTNFFWNH